MILKSALAWMTIFVLASATPAGEPRTGTWGDQGDGTYRNPILNADYPDVDVEQLGDTYYMISSKQHMSPGMVILESKDMVNWRTIGHVWDKLSWDPKYHWDRMDGYRFGGVYHLLGVHVEPDGTQRLFFDADGKVTTGPALDCDALWIRTANDGDQTRFAFSTDGGTFHDFGPTFTIRFGKWTGDRLGFFCFNDDRPDRATEPVPFPRLPNPAL
jgi:beta-xylosidase